MESAKGASSAYSHSPAPIIINGCASCALHILLNLVQKISFDATALNMLAKEILSRIFGETEFCDKRDDNDVRFQPHS